jgi:hypothetical protein
MEAGVDLTINPTHTVIDDTNNPTWTVDELHDAMESYFSQYAGQWPKWHVWSLLASSYISSGVAGIMFDYNLSTADDTKPDRQGCAVFRNHQWFNNLPAGSPANDNEASALRDFLYTYVHELGHCFNLMHSWQKSLANPPGTDRPDSLSWMNYPWMYDQRHSSGDFWANFFLRFDDEELIHIRHGNRKSVIMGGEPFAEHAAIGEIPELVEDAPIEFIVRSKGHFNYLEPVIVELKIKNISESSMKFNSELSPELGSSLLYIQRPDGRILLYDSVMHVLGMPVIREFSPEANHCQNIWAGFGRHGHYFDSPGTYKLRAIYQGIGGVLAPSNIHQITVGTPLSREEEQFAKSYYTPNAGLALYLGGSDSEFLKPGMETIRAVAETMHDSPVGAHLSIILAEQAARPFRLIEKKKRIVKREADPKAALTILDRALTQQETMQSITYHRARRTKATLLAATGKKQEAKAEIKQLIEDLDKRGVKRNILDEIEAYSKEL